MHFMVESLCMEIKTK